MTTSQIKFSEKHIRKISNFDISDIKLQLWFFHPLFASLLFGSPILGQVVGVAHSPCTPGIWFSFSPEGRFSGRQSSLSTSTPCRRSSEISSFFAHWPILFLVFSFDPLASWLLSGSGARGRARAVATDSSSNGCVGSWYTRKLFAQMWNSIPSSISGMRHLYAT